MKIKKLITLASVAAIAALISVGPGQALADTLVVDDDGAQCGPVFTTIGAALAVASSGDTIEVCPGLYTEAVVIG